jgi:hypothetical protein
MNARKEKLQIHIFLNGTKTEIGSFLTASKNIHKAFYKHLTKDFRKYGVCATQCYWKITDLGKSVVF